MADAFSAEQRTATRVYTMLAASIVLGLIPNLWCAIPALLLFCLTPGAATRLRRRAAPDGFVAGHMTFIIRTIWVATGLAAVTMTIGSLYLVSADNITPLQPCVTTMMSAVQAGGQPSALILTRCIGPFLAANTKVFWLAGIMAAAPVLAYLAWRLCRGIALVRRGQLVSNPRSWI